MTAEFNRNVLAVLNRELGADFALDAFEHVARWDAEGEWIEMAAALAPRAARTRPRLSRLEVDFAAGEELRTEISAKFRRERRRVRARARRASRARRWWTDAHGDFGLALARVQQDVGR